MDSYRALLALVAFVPFSLYVFRRLPRAAATAAVVMAGSILLPEKAGFRIPVVQVLDKEYITYLSVLLCAYRYHSRSIAAAGLGRGPEALVGLMFIANAFSALANPDSMMDEGRLEEGLGVYAVIVRTLGDALSLGLPFFLGRALFRTKEDLRVLMTTLAAAGLIYTPLIVVEVLMSIPFRVFQLSHVIYGVDLQPSWRWGVIQPVVFMDNGLSLATLMCSCLIAALGLLKARMPVFRMKAKRARAILLFGLVMSRNVAGVVYGGSLTILAALVSPRTFATIGLALMTLAWTYPATRMAGIFPNKEIVEFARRYDAERARSLEGRFEEEDFVIGAIGSRLWVGWGTYGRVPGAETFGTGEQGLDGWWVLRLGTNGILGVELHYAMFALPVTLAWLRTRRLRSDKVVALLSALMAIVAMRAIDLLLNGWWNHLPMFLAGALYSFSRSLGNEVPMRNAHSGNSRVGVESAVVKS